MRSNMLAAIALVCVGALAACGDERRAEGAAAPGTPSAPSSSPAAAATGHATTSPTAGGTPTKASASGGTSDVSQLERLGITLDDGVLIDVADDGVDRFLQIGAAGVVDFTGTTRADSTMMALKAAPGGRKNQVRVMPPFWNEDLGAGSCVADTPGAALKLETCRAGRPAQVWTVVPAGDSGQFELRGAYGVLRVEGGRITTGGAGRTGLQTIPYAK